MVDLQDVGNKLTKEQKDIMQFIVEARLGGISKLSDLLQLIADDDVLEQVPDYPEHLAIDMNYNFAPSQWRNFEFRNSRNFPPLAFRNLDDITGFEEAKFEPLNDLAHSIFSERSWVITSDMADKKRAVTINRRQDQFLGDIIYGIALAFLARHKNGISSRLMLKPNEVGVMVVQDLYELHISEDHHKAIMAWYQMQFGRELAEGAKWRLVQLSHMCNYETEDDELFALNHSRFIAPTTKSKKKSRKRTYNHEFER